MSEEKKLDAKEIGKIRKILDEASLEKVTFAFYLLESLDAKEGDYVKLFSKTRIKKLIKGDGEMFNLLADRLHPYPRSFSVFNEAFVGLDENPMRNLSGSLTELSDAAAKSLAKMNPEDLGLDWGLEEQVAQYRWAEKPVELEETQPN